MLDLCTSLALIPYFLAAAYALKLGLTGESYEGVTAGRASQGDDLRRASRRRTRCSSSTPPG